MTNYKTMKAIALGMRVLTLIASAVGLSITMYLASQGYLQDGTFQEAWMAFVYAGGIAFVAFVVIAILQFFWKLNSIVNILSGAVALAFVIVLLATTNLQEMLSVTFGEQAQREHYRTTQVGKVQQMLNNTGPVIAENAKLADLFIQGSDTWNTYYTREARGDYSGKAGVKQFAKSLRAVSENLGYTGERLTTAVNEKQSIWNEAKARLDEAKKGINKKNLDSFNINKLLNEAISMLKEAKEPISDASILPPLTANMRTTLQALEGKALYADALPLMMGEVTLFEKSAKAMFAKVQNMNTVTVPEIETISNQEAIAQHWQGSVRYIAGPVAVEYMFIVFLVTGLVIDSALAKYAPASSTAKQKSQYFRRFKIWNKKREQQNFKRKMAKAKRSAMLEKAKEKMEAEVVPATTENPYKKPANHGSFEHFKPDLKKKPSTNSWKKFWEKVTNASLANQKPLPKAQQKPAAPSATTQPQAQAAAPQQPPVTPQPAAAAQPTQAPQPAATPAANQLPQLTQEQLKELDYFALEMAEPPLMKAYQKFGRNINVFKPEDAEKITNRIDIMEWIRQNALPPMTDEYYFALLYRGDTRMLCRMFLESTVWKQEAEANASAA